MNEAARVSLDIFNVLGQKLETLVDRDLEPGDYTYIWNGSNAASGVYFYRFRAGSVIETRKMVLMK